MSSIVRHPAIGVSSAVLLAIAAACADGTSPDAPERPSYTAVAAGFGFTCALTSDQQTYCWGWAGFVHDSVPIKLAAPEPLVSISASPGTFGSNFCGLGATGRAYCWGGMNTTDVGHSYPSSPYAMPDSLRFLSLSAAQGHACGITIDSLAVCWGSYLAGKRGTGGAYPVTPGGVRPWDEIWIDLDPNPVVGGLKFVSLAAGSWHTCGVLGGGNAGQIACWGDSAYVGSPGASFSRGDSICYPAFACVTQPILGPSATGATLLAAGGKHTCVLASQGLRCWGDNQVLQLGAAGGRAGATVLVPLPNDVVVSLSASSYDTCALMQSGAAWCWGATALDSTGYPAWEGKSPAVVPFDGRFVAISAGGLHTCAISDRGRLYCWGSGLMGELGNGSTGSSSVPIEVAPPRS